MKNLKRGFTLVELIVVITILAILGSIAFISLQGYSSDARNSKRTSDLGSIESAMSTQLAEGQAILSFVSGSAVNQLTTPSIAGSNSVLNTDYNAGTVNYSALPVKSTDFQDPSGNASYVMGVTTRKNGKHELAASMEQGAGSKVAKVIGDYSQRTVAAATVAVTITDATNKIVTITNNTDINKLFPADTVTMGGTFTIAKISTDGKTLTLSGSTTPTGANIALSAQEVTGLIDEKATGGGATPVTDGGTNLPY